MDYDATFDYDTTMSQDLLRMQFEMDSYLSSMGLNISGMFGEEDPFNPSFDDPAFDNPGFNDPFQDFFNFSGESGEGGEGGDTIVVTGERQGWFGRALSAIGDFLDVDGDGDPLDGIAYGLGLLGGIALGIAASITSPLWVPALGIALLISGGIAYFTDGLVDQNPGSWDRFLGTFQNS